MLRYAQFLAEVLDQKAALAKLTALADEEYSVWSPNVIPCEAIFHWDADNPPAQNWNDTVTYRKKVGGVKLQNIPVNKLIPTQDGVTVSGITRFIKQNPNRWNEGDEIVRIVAKAGRFYVMDGHHRCAAAILMGYTTVPAELQPLY